MLSHVNLIAPNNSEISHSNSEISHSNSEISHSNSEISHSNSEISRRVKYQNNFIVSNRSLPYSTIAMRLDILTDNVNNVKVHIY